MSSFTDELRCRSGSSLESSSGWILTEPQKERCAVLRIKPPQIAASRFSESVESIGGPVAKSSKSNRLVYFDESLVPECDREKIRTAYHELSRKYHPDLVTDPEAKIQATAIQKDVNAEHDFLKKLCGL